MAEVFTNLARSTLAAGITAASTSLTVQSGDGNNLFPVLAGSDFFRCVLFNKTTGNIEIIRVTARSGDTFTITRAQESIGNQPAIAQAFNAGDIIELRPSAGFFQSLGSVTSTEIQQLAYNYAVDSGVANAYSVALTPSPASYTSPMLMVFLAANSSVAGAATLQETSLGLPKPLTLMDGANLLAGDIAVNQVSIVIYDQTAAAFRLLNPKQSYTANVAKLNLENRFTRMQHFGKGVDLVDANITAGILTLGTGGNFFDVNATTTISGIATSGTVGTTVLLQFDDALQLTHSPDLVLPGNANITTVAGDRALLIEYASGQWMIIEYIRGTNGPDDIISLAKTTGKVPVARNNVWESVGQWSVRDFHRNLVITRPTVSTVNITADEIILQDDDAIPYRAVSVNLTPDITASGANGLDTLFEAPSRFYYLWVIYNPTTNNVAAIFSLESETPPLPSGYTYKARVGAVYNDSTPDLVDFTQYGNRCRTVAREISPGLTAPTNTWNEIDVTHYYPVTAKTVSGIFASSDRIYGVAPDASGNYGWYHSQTDSAVGTTFGGILTSSRGNVGTFRVPFAGSLYYYSASTTAEIYSTGWEY